MISKIYAKVKEYIKKNHNFLLFLLLLIIVLNIKFPYVVERPGGILHLSKQISVNGKNIEDNYATSYVSVSDGNILTLALGFIMPKWDIVSTSNFTLSSDMSYDESFRLDQIAMNQSQSIAQKLVFDKLEIPYEISTERLYVYYKIPEYESLFKYADEIITCDGRDVKNFDNLTDCISDSSTNKVKIGVIRNNKKTSLDVDVHYNEGKKIIGVGIYKDFDIKSDYNIDFSNGKLESGPSGGFMTALALYDELSNNNLSKGRLIAGTGTIDELGTVGEIGGIKYKLLGAEKENVNIFFVPSSNYSEALKVKKKYKLKIKLVKVDSFDDAIKYLENNS